MGLTPHARQGRTGFDAGSQNDPASGQRELAGASLEFAGASVEFRVF